MIFAWKREKKGWRQASILREVSVGTIKMLMLVIIGLRKDGDKSLDGPLQPFHHIVLRRSINPLPRHYFPLSCFP
jgi:hypothetical protein